VSPAPLLVEILAGPGLETEMSLLFPNPNGIEVSDSSTKLLFF